MGEHRNRRNGRSWMEQSSKNGAAGLQLTRDVTGVTPDVTGHLCDTVVNFHKSDAGCNRGDAGCNRSDAGILLQWAGRFCTVGRSWCFGVCWLALRAKPAGFSYKHPSHARPGGSDHENCKLWKLCMAKFKKPQPTNHPSVQPLNLSLLSLNEVVLTRAPSRVWKAVSVFQADHHRNDGVPPYPVV